MIAVRRPGKSIGKAVGKLENLGFKPYLMASFRSNLEHLKMLSVEDLEKTKEILCSVGYHKRLQSSSKPYVKRSEFREWMGKRIHLCEFETNELAEYLNLLFDRMVEVPRIRIGRIDQIKMLPSLFKVLYFLLGEGKWVT